MAINAPPRTRRLGTLCTRLLVEVPIQHAKEKARILVLEVNLLKRVYAVALRTDSRTTTMTSAFGILGPSRERLAVIASLRQAMASGRLANAELVADETECQVERVCERLVGRSHALIVACSRDSEVEHLVAKLALQRSVLVVAPLQLAAVPAPQLPAKVPYVACRLESLISIDGQVFDTFDVERFLVAVESLEMTVVPPEPSAWQHWLVLGVVVLVIWCTTQYATVSRRQPNH